MPLQALQSVELLDPAALRHVVQRLAAQLECKVPSLDYEDLVRRLITTMATSQGSENETPTAARAPTRPTARADLPVEVLKELRELKRSQAQTSAIFDA